jgi:hypothetical protein
LAIAEEDSDASPEEEDSDSCASTDEDSGRDSLRSHADDPLSKDSPRTGATSIDSNGANEASDDAGKDSDAIVGIEEDSIGEHPVAGMAFECD